MAELSIKINLDNDFVDTFNWLIATFGQELAELNGFGEKQLNYTGFIDNFVDKSTVADVSIDGNANVGSKDIVTLENEMSKPHSKLLAFNKIYYEIKKKYNKSQADFWLYNEWVGVYYMHDAYSASQKSYCWAADLTPIAEKGLFFVNNFNAEAPKHLTTFTDFCVEFVSYQSNRSSGAVGLPNFLVWSYYFWKHDVANGYYLVSPEYYRDQEFQRVIYKLNQPYVRSGIQSAFTNFNVFDHPYAEALFGSMEYPDGSLFIDDVDGFIEYQKAFMEVVSKIRSDNMMTFPVLSYSLLYQNGDFVDEEFARWCSDHNMLWADSNFYVSDTVDSLSSCCFSGDQEILWRSSGKGVQRCTFEEFADLSYGDNKRNFTVFHNGSWVKGKLVRLPAAGHQMYKIVTANNKEVVVTENHLFPTLFGDKRADDISTDDYIMFSTGILNPVGHNEDTYERGVLIGMYLGDGSFDSNVVQLSINEEKYKSGFEFITKAVESIDPDAKITLGTPQHNCWPLRISSKKVKTYIRDYVSGNYAYEKRLKCNSIDSTVDFRTGVLDGYYLTDGGNSNRIYTTSKGLADDIEMLCTTLGKATTITVSDRTDEPVIVRGERYKRNYPLYCIRFYGNTNKRDFVDVYKIRNNSIYFKVKSIESVDYSDDYVYCFEMKNQDEPYFTLPNGMITHNCRLRNDIKDLGYFNSIGGTALEVGSVKVSTVNLARIAYNSDVSDDPDVFTKNVYFFVKKNLIALDAQRHIIQRNIEKGLLPNYDFGLVNIDNQYSTVGIIGIYEAIQHFGGITHDEFGYTYYTEEGLQLAESVFKSIHQAIDDFKKDNDIQYKINVEQIPGERAAAVLMQKDQIFFPDETYKLPLYGNQFMPLGVKATIQERIRVANRLDKACNGGSILHVNLESPMTDPEEAWKLLNTIAAGGVTYFAFCTRISACENNHGFYGDVCPICGNPKVTTYQRVVGFLTPVKTYSKERTEEFKLRQWATGSEVGSVCE